MRNKLVLLLVVSALILSTAPFQPALAQGFSGGRYFGETGHWVRGEFYTLWNSADEPLMIYGFPITEEIDDPENSGIRKQYFQRALFTYDPSRPAGFQVDVEAIGLLLFSSANYRTLDAPSMSPNHPACLYDRTTDKLVCYAFRDFYVNYGGVAAFGRPVSNVVMLGDRLVQYFERARLEWHPGLPSGHRVVPANIGEEFFDLYENPILKAPAPDGNISAPILSLRTRISTQKATTRSTDSQSIFIVVQDQQLRRLTGALVDIEVSFPSGRMIHSAATTTNGIAAITFDQEDEQPGLVMLNVVIEIAGKRLVTWYSYRIR